MFKIALGLHPLEISSIFRKGLSFNRNLSYVIDKMPYNYLKKNAPYSLIINWNSLNLSLRAWLNEMPDPKKCNSTANYESNSLSLFNFRCNGFQKAIIDSFLDNYQERVNVTIVTVLNAIDLLKFH